MCFAIFGSTNKVLKAEKVLKQKGIPFRLMPTPKRLAIYCDITVTFDESRIEEVRGLFEKANLKAKDYYLKEGEDYVKV